MPSNCLRRLMLAAASLALIAASPAVRDSEPPAGRLSKAVIPTQYRIELTIDPSRKSFSGKVEIDVLLNGPQDAVWLHGKNLNVSEAYLTASDSSRIEASYAERLESGVALVSFSRTAASGPATLHFAYTAPFNESANALYRIERDDEHYAITQFEAIAARQVFPGFDEPGFKVPFDLAVIARKGDAVITTTPERSAQDLGDGRVRHVFSRTRPLPTYLLAFAVGPYDVVDYGTMPVNAIRNREIPLRGVAAKGQGARMTYALRNTNGMLTLLEKYFGSGYPFEKLDLIAVPESFGGAMENVGAITYDEYFLLMDDDAPLGQRRSHTSLHAHELAHMWFGNLVTPAWWNDIWLNESFASWMQYKIAQQHWPDGEFSRSTLKGALGAMWSDSLAAARKIREPIDENDEIDGAFDSITYAKGGGVLSMLERYVGEAGFQAGVRLHIARHKDGTATSEDFVDSLVKGSGRPEITGAFLSYIEQPGIPLLSVKIDCAQGRETQLRVRQTRYAPLGSAIRAEGNRWQIPFCAAVAVDGARKDRCELLSEREQIVGLGNQACPTMVHPNADGMGYYRFTTDDAGWRALVAGAAAMNPAEALAFADSLDAAFRAGVVSADFYVNGMAALAAHDAWDVADSVTGYLEDITEILDPSQLPAVEEAFRAIAMPRFASLIDASDAGSVLFRRRLQRFLALVAKDEGMRALLAEKAAAIIGLRGGAIPSVAPADEYETIFSVGVQDLGEPYFDLLLKQALASQDAVFRDAALGALARAEDPVLAKKLQAAVLAGELKGVDMVGVIFRQMAWPTTTELTFAWIQENDRAIIAMVPEAFRSYAIPQLGSAFCSTARASDWRAFVESHAERLPGYERDLAQATESIQLCAALKQARGATLAAALAHLPGQAVTKPRNGSVGR